MLLRCYVTPQCSVLTRIAPRADSQQSGGKDPCDHREEARNREYVKVAADDVIVHREGPHIPLQLQHADQSEGTHLRPGKRWSQHKVAFSRALS